MEEAPAWYQNIWCGSWESLTSQEEKLKKILLSLGEPACVCTFGYTPLDAAGGASPAHAGPPPLLPRGSPSYLKEVPKVLAYLGSSFCVSTPFSGALILVLEDWAPGDNGALVRHMHSLPFWGRPRSWGRVRKGRETLAPALSPGV